MSLDNDASDYWKVQGPMKNVLGTYKSMGNISVGKTEI